MYVSVCLSFCLLCYLLQDSKAASVSADLPIWIEALTKVETALHVPMGYRRRLKDGTGRDGASLSIRMIRILGVLCKATNKYYGVRTPLYITQFIAAQRILCEIPHFIHFTALHFAQAQKRSSGLIRQAKPSQDKASSRERN